MFYIGSRTCNIEPVGDIGIKYFTSSSNKEFKTDFKANPYSYTIEVLEVFNNREDATAYEIELHNKYEVTTNTMSYNLSKQTSTGWSTLGYEMPKEAREKISKGLKGKPKTEQAKANMRKARLDNPLSEEAIESIRQSKIGVKRPQHVIDKLVETHTGKIMSKETCEKISIAHTGKVLSEETKQKISDAKSGVNHPYYGKILSEEHKEKISKSLKNIGGSFNGKHHTEETKEKIRQAKLGKKASEEAKEKMRQTKAINKITGLDHFLTLPVDIYNYKTKELIAKNVSAKEWSLINKYDVSAIRKTAKADRSKVHHWKDNPHHTKGVYATYALA